MALARRSPPKELLVHSDQGSPYTATDSVGRVGEMDIVVSMSRTGDCDENAVMESFFSTLKDECVDRHHFQSRA